MTLEGAPHLQEEHYEVFDCANKCGAKGKRYALPNAEILLHQIMGGAEGQASEIEITARQIIKMKRLGGY